MAIRLRQIIFYRPEGWYLFVVQKEGYVVLGAIVIVLELHTISFRLELLNNISNLNHIQCINILSYMNVERIGFCHSLLPHHSAAGHKSLACCLLTLEMLWFGLPQLMYKPYLTRKVNTA